MSETFKLIRNVALVALIALVGILAACVQATVVGNDLLGDDLQVVGFTDTLPMRMVTRTEDSVLTHSSASGGQIIRHNIGNLDDPFFGKSSSIVSTEVFLNGVATEILDYVVDSVVVSLTYYSDDAYGDLTSPVTIDAYKVGVELDPLRDYYSNERIGRDFVPSGYVQDHVPNLFDSVLIERPGDTSFLRPQLRIKMTDDFIQQMTSQPTATFELQDSFAAWLKGLQFDMSAGPNTMLAVNLNDAQSGMTVYYSSQDTLEIYDSYQFIFRNPSFFDFVQVQHAQFEHDYTGSEVEQYIDNETLTDSLVYIQSFSGVNAEMEIVGLEQADNLVVNAAEMELFLADIPEDNLDVFPRIIRIQTRTVNEDGILVNSRDVNLALSIQELDVFGGTAEMVEGGLYRYKMNMTAVVQDIVQQRAANRIFISSYLKANQPNRSIFYGPGNSEYPARLKIAFTRTE